MLSPDAPLLRVEHRSGCSCSCNEIYLETCFQDAGLAPAERLPGHQQPRESEGRVTLVLGGLLALITLFTSYSHVHIPFLGAIALDQQGLF